MADQQKLLPNVTVVMVNHQHPRQALAQLQAFYDDDPGVFASMQWILVHNGSEDNRPQLPPDQPWSSCVTVLVTPNQGYGAAVNQARGRSDRPYILALNADLRPLPGALEELGQLIERLQLADSSGPVGIVGTQLQNPDGTRQGSVGRRVTLFQFLIGLLRPRHVRKYVFRNPRHPVAVPWVTGACLLMQRACLDDLNWFDEGFFLYYEDVDLCQRAWHAGWRVWFDPAWKMSHFHPYHSRDISFSMLAFARQGLLRYFGKFRPRWETALLRQIMLAECRFRQWREKPTHPDYKNLVARWKNLAQVLHRLGRPPHPPPKPL